MARILFSTTLGASPWAGSEVLWYQAAEVLRTRGHTVGVHLPSQMNVEENHARLDKAGLESIKGITDGGLAMVARLQRRLQPATPTLRAPIVRHANKWNAELVVISQASCWGAYSEMLALARREIPYICISQLNTPFSWPGDQLFEVIGDAFARADAAVFVSQGNLRLFQNQVARVLNNAQVIYNPPSFDVSVPCGPPHPGDFRLLSVARIDPAHKGQDILLDVLALPKWRERDVNLEIAGGGNRSWMERLIAVKGLEDRVRLLGHENELTKVWERSTFGVFPSRYEGMPLAMIEGMALGRAVIATDVAGHREWIEDGRNGFIASGAGAVALDDSLDRAWLARDRAQELGIAARLHADERLSVPSSDRLCDVIEKALART